MAKTLSTFEFILLIIYYVHIKKCSLKNESEWKVKLKLAMPVMPKTPSPHALFFIFVV